MKKKCYKYDFCERFSYHLTENNDMNSELFTTCVVFNMRPATTA